MSREYKKYFETTFPYEKQRDVVWKEVIVYLSHYFKPDMTILEIGPGHGHFINNVSAKNKIAIDINLSCKDYLHPSIIFFDDGISSFKNLENSSVDIIFASHVLEHLTIEEGFSLLEESYRILKNNGKLILIQPNFRYAYREYFDDYTHKTVYDHQSLSDIIKVNGFIVELLKPKFLPHSMKQIKRKLPFLKLMVKFYLNLPIKPFSKQMLIIGSKPLQNG